MKNTLIILFSILLFTSCIKEESPSKARRLIENITNKNVVIEAFDSLGHKSELYNINSFSEYVISDWMVYETVPVQDLFYEDFDSIYVKIGDSITVHYNRNIILAESGNKLAFTNSKNFFYNGWEVKKTKLGKEKQKGNYSVEFKYRLD